MPAKKAKLAPQTAVYCLKVTLLGTDPPVWRKLEARGDTSLRRLHGILQAAFGWDDSHLHEFLIGRRRIGPGEHDGFGEPPEDEHEVILAQIAPRKRSRFLYSYDFGDSWEHEVRVEGVSPPTNGQKYPRCTDGARACPPEDCGGIPGYENLIEAVADPQHPDHQELLGWLGVPFDPELFDLRATNARVQRLR